MKIPYLYVCLFVAFIKISICMTQIQVKNWDFIQKSMGKYAMKIDYYSHTIRQRISNQSLMKYENDRFYQFVDTMINCCAPDLKKDLYSEFEMKKIPYSTVFMECIKKNSERSFEETIYTGNNLLNIIQHNKFVCDKMCDFSANVCYKNFEDKVRQFIEANGFNQLIERMKLDTKKLAAIYMDINICFIHYTNDVYQILDALYIKSGEVCSRLC